MHRFNSTETTYSFCFFGDITANGSISLGRYQRWTMMTVVATLTRVMVVVLMMMMVRCRRKRWIGYALHLI